MNESFSAKCQPFVDLVTRVCRQRKGTERYEMHDLKIVALRETSLT